MLKKCTYTEGVKDYYSQANCYWLHDIFQTELHRRVKLLKPDLYYVNIKVENNRAEIVMVDYKDNELYSKVVSFTDHPEGTMTLYFGWNGDTSTICLPSEN